MPAGGLMLLLWRSLIWVAGSLSVAAIARTAIELPLLPLFATVLESYDRTLRLVLNPLTPVVSALLPAADDALGSGAALQPYWPHLLLVAGLHMAPQAGGDQCGARVRALWWAQILGAIGGAIGAAAVLGGAPLLSANIAPVFIMAVLIACELIVNVAGDLGSGLVDRVAEFETGDVKRPVTWRSILRYSAGSIVTLTVIMIVTLYFFVRSASWDMLCAYFWVPLLAYVGMVALVIVWALIRRPREEAPMLRRGFFEAPMTHIARAALAMALFGVTMLFSASGESPRRGTRRMMILVLALALPIASLFIVARLGVNWLLGRDVEDQPPPQPSTLGVFLIGGALVLGAQEATMLVERFFA